MFKIIVLKSQYNLSDEMTEFFIRDHKTFLGNITITYADDQASSFSVPVMISLPSCCRIISGDMRLTYSKDKKESITKKIVVLSHHSIPVKDLLIQSVPSWIHIKEIIYERNYAYVTMEYKTAELPSAWRGQIFEVSTSSKRYAASVCRCVVYEND